MRYHNDNDDGGGDDGDVVSTKIKLKYLSSVCLMNRKF